MTICGCFDDHVTGKLAYSVPLIPIIYNYKGSYSLEKPFVIKVVVILWEYKKGELLELFRDKNLKNYFSLSIEIGGFTVLKLFKILLINLFDILY